MTCEDAFKRLYDFLNSETDNIDVKKLDKHLKLCRLTCDTCRFEGNMRKVMTSFVFRDKASPSLKAKILKNLKSTS